MHTKPRWQLSCDVHLHTSTIIICHRDHRVISHHASENVMITLRLINRCFFFSFCALQLTMKPPRVIQTSTNICTHSTRTHARAQTHTRRVHQAALHLRIQGSRATFLPTRPRDIHTDLFKGTVLIQFSPYS